MENKNNIDFAVLEKKGFLIVDLFETQELNEIENLFKTLNDVNFEFSGLKYSLMMEDLTLKKEVSQKLKKVLDAKELSGLQNFGASFIQKTAESKIEFNLHQDWSYTDEKKFVNCYTLWVPLQDVDESNGCLYVLPRSHSFFNNYRSTSLDTTRISILENEALKKHIISLPMKKGQALLFKQALFHGSFPNKSNADRVCFVSILKNADVPLYYYHKISDTKIEKYLVTEDLFDNDLKAVSSGEIPNYFKPLKVIKYRHEIVNVNSLMNKLK